MLNKYTNIYVVKTFEKTNCYYIKVGKSINVNDRLNSYKCITPEVKLLCSVYDKEEKEYDLIRSLEESYNKICKESFIIPKDKISKFVKLCCWELNINGHSNNLDFKIITGCYYSHHSNYHYPSEHMNCDDRCVEKMKYYTDRNRLNLNYVLG